MNFYTSLLLTISLLASAYALPKDSAQLLTRDAPAIYDVPAHGVTCATANEPAHNITSEEISTAMSVGKQFGFQFPQFSSGHVTNDLGLPKQFSSDMLGKDAAGNRYTVYVSPICGGKVDGLQAFYVGDMSSSNPDLVLYQVIWVYERMDHSNGAKNGPDVADVRFCAIVTNSDATSAEKPGGYRQCNANP